MRALGPPGSPAEASRREGREVWLVRHGETAWAREGRHTGRSDVPLSEAGEAQARALGALLGGRRFALVLCSPFRRAHDTCRLAGYADGARLVPDLAEWDYGSLEGRLRADVLREQPGWTVWRGPTPGGESVEDVGARAARVLAAVEGADGDVAIFAHGYILRALAAMWVGQPARFGERLALEPAAVSILGWEHGERVIRAWNLG